MDRTEMVIGFRNATRLVFEARGNNLLEYRVVRFSKTGWIRITQFFENLDITPDQLRDIFCLKGVEVITDEIINDWDDLGSLPNRKMYFRRLADLLGKPVDVDAYSGSTGEHWPQFSVVPTTGKNIWVVRWEELKQEVRLAYRHVIVKERLSLLRRWSHLVAVYFLPSLRSFFCV